jgi:hypothetical protein
LTYEYLTGFYADDFIQQNTTNNIQGGTGAQTWSAGTKTRPGVYVFTVGTGSGTTNFFFSVNGANTTSTGSMFIDDGFISISHWLRVPTKATSGDNFRTLGGFFDNITAPTSRCIWNFQDGVNGGAITLNTQTGSGAVTVTNGSLVPASATDYVFTIIINAGTATLFSRVYGGTDTQECQTSTSITASAVFACYGIARVAGTTARTAEFDGYRVIKRLAANR